MFPHARVDPQDPAPIGPTSLRQRRIERRRYEILELAARDAPLGDILAGLIGLIETSVPETIGTILRVDGGRVYHAASSAAMPAAFAAAIDGASIGPSEGSCGTAAFLNETVIVEDIENDPRWIGYRALALPLGLRSCWSTPITNGERVIGTLAFYARTVRRPTDTDLRYLHEAGNVASIAMASHDARVRLEEMLHRDALTDVPNRLAFEKALLEATEDARTSGRQLAAGVLGLNRFKTVNDSLGRVAGDRLLVDVAKRLQASVRPGDGFARLGSDEFACFFRNVEGRADAERLCRTLLATLDSPMFPGGQELYVRVTAGMSVFPEDASEARQLLSQAETALSAAKTCNDQVGFHSGSQTLDGKRRLTIETQLGRALANREFELHYQPIVSLRDGRMFGAEALLRWQNPVLGRTPPDQFVPIAEESGLIVPIGSWVLAEACRFARTWGEAGGPGTVAVNVSALQLAAPDFVEVVKGALTAGGLIPTRLCLEITESAILRSPETAAERLAELRKLGVRCGIDDFGTGYSSLHRLMRFPGAAIKIDRSFLAEIGRDDGTAGTEAKLFAAIVAVGRALQLDVVAEGVETQSQRDFLTAIGCDFAQGFLIARPMPGDLLLRDFSTLASLRRAAETAPHPPQMS